MRIHKVGTVALCAIALLLGALMMATSATLFQASAGAAEYPSVDQCLTLFGEPVGETEVANAGLDDTVPCCTELRLSVDEAQVDDTPLCEPPLCEIPSPGYEYEDEPLQRADLGYGDPCVGFDPCAPQLTMEERRVEVANLVDGPGPICCIDAPAPVFVNGDGGAANLGPVQGPGGLCVPVCPIPLYVPVFDSPDALTFSSSDLGYYDGPGCIEICGTVPDMSLLSSDLHLEGGDGYIGGPPCVPICGPSTPLIGGSAADLHGDEGPPPCVLPCGSVDLVRYFPYGPTAAGIASADVRPTDGPPPCVPPCIDPDAVIHDGVISAASMRRAGPAPLQPCIPPCPSGMPNPFLTSENEFMAGGYVILCDPCVDEPLLDGPYDSATLETAEPQPEPVLMLDGDCDEVPDAVDCDPEDETVTNSNENDADCDQIPTGTDCNDNDATVTNTTDNDADCDQIPTGTDCNDLDPTNLCISLDDPYVCGQGFFATIDGGTAPYTVSYTLVPANGGSTTQLTPFVVAAAGPFTTPNPSVAGVFDVTVSVTDAALVATSVGFRDTITSVCDTGAPLLPGISDAQVEEILDIVVANRNPVPDTVDELDAVTAAPVGVSSSGGALALTGTETRVLAALAMAMLGFGLSLVGSNRIRRGLPDED